MGINAETDWETQHDHMTCMSVCLMPKQTSINNDTKCSQIRSADDNVDRGCLLLRTDGIINQPTASSERKGCRTQTNEQTGGATWQRRQGRAGRPAGAGGLSASDRVAAEAGRGLLGLCSLGGAAAAEGSVLLGRRPKRGHGGR